MPILSNKEIGYSLKRIFKYLEEFFKSIGFLWLITEVLTFIFKSSVNFLSSTWWIAILISVIYSLIKNHPIKKYKYKVEGRDTSIEIALVDAFDLKGALIIPFNSYLHIELKGYKMGLPSIQSKLIRDVYQGNHSLLQDDISNSIEDFQIFGENVNEDCYYRRKFKIGTVIPIIKDKRQYYFLVSSHLNSSGRATCTDEDIKEALANLWVYLSENCDKGEIVIPLIGTGSARITRRREEIAYEIVKSFIASCSYSNYCDRLIISILPSDIAKFNIDIEKICNYVSYACQYTDFSDTVYPREGTPVG